ncbi:MAG TPA: hypothetical protein VH253_03085 [Phycisphaerae bacterium]|nr:hypothetical protein [Phycisphaerae bacterium]
MRILLIGTMVLAGACAAGCSQVSSTPTAAAQTSSFIPAGQAGDTFNGVPVSQLHSGSRSNGGYLNGVALPNWGAAPSSSSTSFLDGISGYTFNGVKSMVDGGVNTAQTAVNQVPGLNNVINVNGVVPKNFGGGGNIPGTTSTGH